MHLDVSNAWVEFGENKQYSLDDLIGWGHEQGGMASHTQPHLPVCLAPILNILWSRLLARPPRDLGNTCPAQSTCTEAAQPQQSANQTRALDNAGRLKRAHGNPCMQGVNVLCCGRCGVMGCGVRAGTRDSAYSARWGPWTGRRGSQDTGA